jgi:CO dehydrogenase/acetyl-CoA synthase epsilon subunit
LVVKAYAGEENYILIMSGKVFMERKGRFTKNCAVCEVELKNVAYNRKYCDEHRKNYNNLSYGLHYELLKKLF